MKLFDANKMSVGNVATVTTFGDGRIMLTMDDGRDYRFNKGEVVYHQAGNCWIMTKREKKSTNKMTLAFIKRVIFNPPATIVFWSDGSKTVVKCSKSEPFDTEKGLAMAIAKRAQGNREDYYKDLSKWCGGASAQKAKEKSKNDILDEILELIASAKNTIKDLDKVRSKVIAFNGGQIDALLKLDYATDHIEDLKKN